MVITLGFMLFFIPKGLSLDISNTTILYGGRGSLSCTGNTGSNIKWLQGDTDLSVNSDDYTITSSGSTSELTIHSLTETEDFNCTEDSDSTTATARVANIAGISSPLCRDSCRVSCILSDLTEKNKPKAIKWVTSSGIEVSSTAKEVDGVRLRKEDSPFLYTSQESTLTIEDLSETSYFTCVFSLLDDSELRSTVSALLRPTTKCDVTECNEEETCRSTRVVNDTACRTDCQDCYNYNYTLGDFYLAGQCMKDSPWCKAYLDTGSLCKQGDPSDAIFRYCVDCGYCMNLELVPGKLVLPLVILTCLCLLTVYMCYKAYEEKRSLLPKVQITNVESEVPASRPPDKRSLVYENNRQTMVDILRKVRNSTGPTGQSFQTV